MSFLLNPFTFGSAPVEPAGFTVASMKFASVGGSQTTVDFTQLQDANGDPVILEENDFLLINFGLSATSNLTMSSYLPTDSGSAGVWELIAERYHDHSTDANQAIYTRRVPAGGLASAIIPAAGVSADGVAGTVHAFRGVHLAQPLDADPIGGGTNNGSDFIPNPPAIFVSTPNAIVVACGVGATGGGVSGNALTAGANLDPQHFQNQVTAGGSRCVSVATGIATTATANASFNPDSFGGSSAFGDSNACVTVVLRSDTVGTVGSWDFDGSNDYMEQASAVVSGLPCTICAWVKPDATTTDAIAAVGNGGGSSRIQADKDGTNFRAQSISTPGGVANFASSGAYDITSWQHVAAKFTSITSRQCFRNGVGGTVDTVSNSPGSFTRTNIGTRFASGTRGAFFNGKIAHVAIWSIELSDAEIAQLAAGALPTTIQPGSLVYYVPLNTATATVNTVTSTAQTVSGPVFSPEGPVVG